MADHSPITPPKSGLGRNSSAPAIRPSSFPYQRFIGGLAPSAAGILRHRQARAPYTMRPAPCVRRPSSMPTTAATLLNPTCPACTLRHRGKVRDVFDLPRERLPAATPAGDYLLMVATDRLSAFDVVLPDPIPGKGEMLCQVSNFWFDKTAHLMPNHLTGIDVASVLPEGVDPALYAKRAVVKEAQAGAGGSDRPRLPDRQRLEGLPAHRRGQRHRPARWPAPGRAAARADLHPVDQGRGRRPRREHRLRRDGRRSARELAERVRDATLRIYTLRRRLRRASAASSWPTPSSSSAPTTTAACT